MLDDCRFTKDVFTQANDVLSLKVVPALHTIKETLIRVSTAVFRNNIEFAARWSDVLNDTLTRYVNDTYYCDLIGCDLNITLWKTLEIEPFMLDANDTRFDHIFRCHNETWNQDHNDQPLEIYHNGTVCYNTTIPCNFTLYVNYTTETPENKTVCCNITNEDELYEMSLELYQNGSGVCYNATIECNETIEIYDNGTFCCNSTAECSEFEELQYNETLCCNDTMFETCEDIVLFGKC